MIAELPTAGGRGGFVRAASNPARIIGRVKYVPDGISCVSTS
jgi:hypothetical protein